MTKLRRNAILAVVIAAVAAFFAVRAFTGGDSVKHLSLDEYTARLGDGKVSTATIHDKDHTVTGELKNGTEYEVGFPDRYTGTITQDIVDSGLTLAYLRKNLAARGPASMEVCALLVKEGLQRVELDLKYVGFTIPPKFVVGYGLDVGERYRNLPAVYEFSGMLTG